MDDFSSVQSTTHLAPRVPELLLLALAPGPVKVVLAAPTLQVAGVTLVVAAVSVPVPDEHRKYYNATKNIISPLPVPVVSALVAAAACSASSAAAKLRVRG